MKYESKQQQINKPTELIFSTLSSFSNFTPILQDKVEGWQATEDKCSFRAQGFNVELEMVERTRPTLIKIAPAAGGGIPFAFNFFVQLKEVAPSETRMRIVLDVELNMMLKMMIGSKLQDAVDKIAEQIAQSFNKI